VLPSHGDRSENGDAISVYNINSTYIATAVVFHHGEIRHLIEIQSFTHANNKGTIRGQFPDKFCVLYLAIIADYIYSNHGCI